MGLDNIVNVNFVNDIIIILLIVMIDGATAASLRT